MFEDSVRSTSVIGNSFVILQKTTKISAARKHKETHLWHIRVSCLFVFSIENAAVFPVPSLTLAWKHNRVPCCSRKHMLFWLFPSLPWGNTFWTHSRFPSTLLAWLGNTTAFIGYFLFKRGNTYECQGKHIFLQETQTSFLSSAPLLSSIAVSVSNLYSKVHATVYLYCLPAVSITVLFVAR